MTETAKFIGITLMLTACGGAGLGASRAASLAPPVGVQAPVERAGKPLAEDGELHATYPAFAFEEDDPRWGSPDAPVAVVIHGSVHAADNSANLVRRLIAEYPPARVRVAIKHCEDALDRAAMASAVAAQSVFRLQGADRFLTFVEALAGRTREFARDKSLAQRIYEELAAPLGVSAAALRAEMSKPVVASSVRRDSRWPPVDSIRCMRRVFVNGRQVSAWPANTFDDVLSKAIRDAEARAAASPEAGAEPSRFYAEEVTKARRAYTQYSSEPPPPPYYALTWMSASGADQLGGPDGWDDPLLEYYAFSDRAAPIVDSSIVPELGSRRAYVLFGVCPKDEADAWLARLQPLQPSLTYVQTDELPYLCPKAPDPRDGGTPAAVESRTSIGALSVRILLGSQGDFGVATLTDGNRRVVARKAFGGDECSLEAPVASPDGRIIVGGNCISSRCGAMPQRSEMTFEITPGKGLQVSESVGEIVQECAGE